MDLKIGFSIMTLWKYVPEAHAQFHLLDNISSNITNWVLESQATSHGVLNSVQGKLLKPLITGWAQARFL